MHKYGYIIISIYNRFSLTKNITGNYVSKSLRNGDISLSEAQYTYHGAAIT